MMNQEKIPTEEDGFDGNNRVQPDQDETQHELPDVNKNNIDSDTSEQMPGNNKSKIINHDIPDEDA